MLHFGINTDEEFARIWNDMAKGPFPEGGMLPDHFRDVAITLKQKRCLDWTNPKDEALKRVKAARRAGHEVMWLPGEPLELSPDDTQFFFAWDRVAKMQLTGHSLADPYGMEVPYMIVVNEVARILNKAPADVDAAYQRLRKEHVPLLKV